MGERVIPMWELSPLDQWTRHRDQHPGHTATVRNDGIYCDSCLWHTYSKAERDHAREATP